MAGKYYKRDRSLEKRKRSYSRSPSRDYEKGRKEKRNEKYKHSRRSHSRDRDRNRERDRDRSRKSRSRSTNRGRSRSHKRKNDLGRSKDWNQGKDIESDKEKQINNTSIINLQEVENSNKLNIDNSFEQLNKNHTNIDKVTYDDLDEDLFLIKEIKESEEIKNREERKKRLEKLKCIETIEYGQNQNKIDENSNKTIEQKIIKNESFNLNISKEDTVKLLNLIETQREIELQEELKKYNEAKSNGVNSPATPDMFAATPEDILINHNKNLKQKSFIEDTTGYYSPSLDEIIGGKYKIIGFCGKGIFSNVVKVVDINTGKELAVKIIRAIDIMLLSGEKERSILKKINEIDVKGN